MTTHSIGVDFDRLDTGTRVVSRGRTITETDLVSFSALTGDWHPQHADATWAATSQFGERIAHGMLVLSYAIGLLPIDPDRVVALRGIRSVAFKRPVPIGATIRVEAEVAGLRPLDAGHGLVELALRVRDGHDRLVARATIDALWRRAPQEQPSANGGRAASGANDAAPADPDLLPLAEGRVLC
jgi:acyl dehydratase